VVCFDPNKKNEILSWYNQKSLRLHLGKQNDPFGNFERLVLSTTSILIDTTSGLFSISFTEFQSASSSMDISDFRIDKNYPGLIYWYQDHIWNQKANKGVDQKTSEAILPFSFRGKLTAKEWYPIGISSPLFLYGGYNKVITIESNETEQAPAISIDTAIISGNPACLHFCSYPYLAWTEDDNDTKLHLIFFSNQ
jgi:hypothetical protein